MNRPFKVKAKLLKKYDNMFVTLPKGITVNGYYDRGTLVFYSNNVCYTASCIDDYAEIEIVE